MKALHKNILERLDQIINNTGDHIHDFINNPHAFTRKRTLDAATVLKTTINMQGQNLNSELFRAFGKDATKKNDKVVSTSAYVQRKSQLSPACFKHILTVFNQNLFNIQLFDHHYRLFAIDGSDFNQIWNPKSNNIVQASSHKKKPYCQIHVNALYDLLNNTYQDCIFQPKSEMDERKAAVQMLKALNCGPYIVTMDRGYTSFNMIENCNRLPNCHYIIRTKAGKGGVKEITTLPDQECDREISCLVTTSNYYYITHKASENIHHVQHHYRQYIKYRSKNTQDLSWDFGELCTIKFRACKFRINDAKSGKEEWEVVLTNLDRKNYPLKRIKELYHLRWGIETSFKKLKYSLGSVQFHSKQDKFIEMEIYAHMIMFNAISQIDAQAYIPQKHCKYQYAINFKQSCLIIQSMYLASSSTQDFERILIQISYYTIPIRPGRKDKRNIKPKSAVYYLYRVA
ncbi:IS4 family transposase [Lactobacillus crispatus]|uniref:IS4 family transposase n=2 Tax=Lactobacillus TaxID=1578 RepID=UPI001958291C|nr:IS4 family transposase [Lactobacillus crispatus]MBM6873571.1 IS4 family transposase [Lactobacillus crispatus]